MEKCYSSDLSDGEWECLELHVPSPNKLGRPRIHGAREVLNAVFYVLKSGCPWRLLPKDLERPGRPSTGGSGNGGRTAPSSGSTPPYAGCCGFVRAGIRSRVRASPTRKRPRPPGSAASRGDTMATRRYEAGKGTCSWTRRAWCSRPRSTEREGTGPGWTEAPAGVRADRALAPEAPVGGRWLPREG